MTDAASRTPRRTHRSAGPRLRAPPARSAALQTSEGQAAASVADDSIGAMWARMTRSHVKRDAVLRA
jgi:hypothetical protein